VFFKNKKGKYTDVEGYNRISRLIEDRQREVGQTDMEEDDLDEGTVLLSREPAGRERGTPRTLDDRQSTSAVRPLSQSQGQPGGEQPSGAHATQAPGAAAAASAPADERRIPFQPAGMETQPMPAADFPPATPEAPRMTVPDIGASTLQGSLVAADAVWEGKLITNGNLRVEGTVHGEVQTSGTLFVAAHAHIDATIQARSILLAGEIEGQIHCSERLEILPGGSARGEIQTGTLVVHEGAFIDSRFQMRQPEAPARR
jgi:cytoskeletal protein CcmA (bactofilin family)